MEFDPPTVEYIMYVHLSTPRGPQAFDLPAGSRERLRRAVLRVEYGADGRTVARRAV